jgi:hypothetical protein
MDVDDTLAPVIDQVLEPGTTSHQLEAGNCTAWSLRVPPCVTVLALKSTVTAEPVETPVAPTVINTDWLVVALAMVTVPVAPGVKVAVGGLPIVPLFVAVVACEVAAPLL